MNSPESTQKIPLSELYNKVPKGTTEISQVTPHILQELGRRSVALSQPDDYYQQDSVRRLSKLLQETSVGDLDSDYSKFSDEQGVIPIAEQALRMVVNYPFLDSLTKKLGLYSPQRDSGMGRVFHAAVCNHMTDNFHGLFGITYIQARQLRGHFQSYNTLLPHEPGTYDPQSYDMSLMYEDIEKVMNRIKKGDSSDR